MYLIDHSYTTPEQNLAFDDALLDYVESQHLAPYLRFWEPPQTFVVLGHGNKSATEVNLSACKQDSIPVFRRQSGGGTILQGEGVLNYSLVLPLSYHDDLHAITTTNSFVMNNVAEALQALDKDVSVNGITDIVIDSKKIIGNAQRRKRRTVLFHGCILVSLDLSLISKYLQHPSSEPDYRESRSHNEFLTHLNFSNSEIKSALISHWGAKSSNLPDLDDMVEKKITEYYAQKSWNFKF